MKSKKLLLPIIIIAAAIVAMSIYGVVTNIAQKPTITEKAFPFSITYEYNGETITIEDNYSAFFTGNDGYVKATGRQYDGHIDGLGEDGGASYILRNDPDGTIYLHTNFYADYLLGDPQYDHFNYWPFEPTLVYYDAEYNEYTDAESLAAQGVRLIDWEYPEPIENSLVFSKISHLSAAVVFPFALIAALALILVIIFVKKDQDLCKKTIDKISIALNFAIGLTVLPFTTIFGIFSDINGSTGALLHQIGYLMPAITLLGLAASVSLRRKGFHKGSFIAQFAGPLAFALLIVCLLITEFYISI